MFREVNRARSAESGGPAALGRRGAWNGKVPEPQAAERPSDEAAALWGAFNAEMDRLALRGHEQRHE